MLFDVRESFCSSRPNVCALAIASVLAWLLFGGLYASIQGPASVQYQQRQQAPAHNPLHPAAANEGWLGHPPGPRRLKVYTYVRIPQWGKAFERIHKALILFKPDWVTVVESSAEADVHIVHALGAGEVADVVHPHTIIIQHVTLCDMTNVELVRLWASVMLVASFHDLDRHVGHHAPQLQHAVRTMNLPWGASPKDFIFTGGGSKKATGTARYAFITGEIPETESHREVLRATAKAGMSLKHTGHSDSLHAFCQGHPDTCSRYQHLPFQSHTDFQCLLREASWVPVLRQHEGFEMMGVEALFSGSRPIVYDLDTLTQPYRWFKGHAALVPPERPDLPEPVPDDLLGNSTVVAALERLLAHPPKEISREEIGEIHRKFSWEVIIPAFYERIWVELQSRLTGGPQPSEPRLAAPLLPSGSWQEAARAALVACLKGDNSTIDQFGRTAEDTRTGACPAVAIPLTAEDRTFDHCQDAALLAAHLDGHITPPAPLPPSCRAPTYILLTPGAYPAALAPLFNITSKHQEIWLLHLAATLPSSRPLPHTASIILQQGPPSTPNPGPSSFLPKALARSRAKPIPAPLPLLSLDPRDAATARLPAYSEFLLVIGAGAEHLAYPLLAHWASRPVHPHLHIATSCPRLLATIAQYRTGTHPSTPYNVTNIHPLDPATLSTPASLAPLLEFGVHIHAVAPPTPHSPSPAAHPHLANLARSVGAALILPFYSRALEPLLEGQQAASDLDPAIVPSVITYGAAVASGDEAMGGQLVGAVERVAQMAVWQRMLVGQRGQQAYVMDAERYQRRLKALAMRSSLYAKEGCAWCEKRPGADGLWVGPDMGDRPWGKVLGR